MATGADEGEGTPYVLIDATGARWTGAQARVAGLTVLARACRQVQRLGSRPVVLVEPQAAARALALVPAATEVVTDSVAAASARWPGAPIVPADLVRPATHDLRGGLPVTSDEERRAAEDAIFAELLRGDLGLVARYLNKPLSFRFTRYVLCRLPVTPNQVTLAAALVGLLGAWLVASGAPLRALLGLLLAHAQSVLDGCDGELARVRFQQSAIGEWLDTIVDDALNVALFAAVGVGASRALGSPAAGLVGVTAALAMALYSTVAYRELRAQGQGGEVLKVRWWFAGGVSLKERYAQAGAPTLISRVLSLGRRDAFLFVWLCLGLVGYVAHWRGVWILLLAYVSLLAASSGLVAVGQLIYRGLRPRG